MAFGQFAWRALIAVVCLVPARGVPAAEPCTPVVGRILSVQGLVDVQRAAEDAWAAVDLDEGLCPGDTIRAGDNSRAAVSLINDAVLRLDQNTTLRLFSVEPEETSLLNLIFGAVHMFSRQPRALEVSTPYVNAAVEGTEFLVRVLADRTLVTVFEGTVAAVNAAGALRLARGEAAEAPAGEAPRPVILVRPRGAVQWSLYYPPILTERAAETAAPDLLRAHRLLAVGRVDATRAAIDRVLAEGDDGLAYALRAGIAVARNEKDQALADARQGVALSPTAAPEVALSYALQARFELEAARDALLRAVDKEPDNALAWARLAELWLALGYRGKALDVAERAASLDAETERVQTVLGFAALTAIDLWRAREAFARAIRLDPASPLPRFGLGLAKVREGDLAGGRADMEAAVALDSTSALLRAYLGKAYFEEKRAPLDARQFALAKELDPRDPTAYLYDAIRLQSENRPVEALRELDTSIRLNDNRAVYRSRLQLDQDLAARGTSLGRVYDDLGFTQLGMREATRSITLDPANASAHRFLSDLQRSVPRREIARVSDLLQAQLLQDININPVQPSVAETNLNIATLGGPAQSGLNEFTPLFDRNQAQLNATGGVGTQKTFLAEGAVSGLYNELSVSAGHFHFESDGFRTNNDNKQDVTALFAQAAVTPFFNAQAEYRRRDSEEGDLFFNFDPDVFSDTLLRDLESETARVGFRLDPTPQSSILLSVVYADRDETIDEFILGDRVTLKTQDDGYQVEGQYLGDFGPVDLVTGFNTYDFNVKTIDIDAFFGTTDVSRFVRQQRRGYVYSHVNYPQDIVWTFGFSLDSFDERDRNLDEISGKFGVQWDVTDYLRLRAAAFQVVTPALAGNQTLEPTQIAGFTQFFDDANGSVSRLYGAGLDVQIAPDLKAGAEGYVRDVRVPLFFPPQPGALVSGTFLEDHEEEFIRAYAYWTPHPEWAFSVEPEYDKFVGQELLNSDTPTQVETITVPIFVRYFHPEGFFASFGVNIVDQDVERAPDSDFAAGHDTFALIDAGIGYRFPDRMGIASIEVRNLLDRSFNFQDDNFREFERTAPSTSRFIPERTVLGRMTLNF